jgi:hypothetical protein
MKRLAVLSGVRASYFGPGKVESGGGVSLEQSSQHIPNSKGGDTNGVMMIDIERPHGDRATYRWGCRCELCTRANADYVNANRIKMLEAAKEEMDKTEQETGTRKVTSWKHGIRATAVGKGCRCEECKPIYDANRIKIQSRTNTRKILDSFLEVFDDRSAANE